MVGVTLTSKSNFIGDLLEQAKKEAAGAFRKVHTFRRRKRKRSPIK